MRPTVSHACRAIALLLAIAAALSAPAPGTGRFPPAARAEGGWSDEFADVCAKTQDAMALTDAELRGLVERCDKLKPVIEQLPPTERKVYSRRLSACRDLYQYVLDSRDPKGTG